MAASCQAFCLDTKAIDGRRRPPSSGASSERRAPGSVRCVKRERRRFSPCARVAGSVPAAEYTVVMLVPTGIGARIGGYAGDALPAARALASVVDCLITHPNVLNGAMLYWPLHNVMYVEGFALDKFCAGEWQLHNRPVGMILDRAIEPELRLRHLQAADAVRATLGVDVRSYAVTDGDVGVRLALADDGSSWGSVDRSDTLVDAGRRLLADGCDALAVVTRFPEDGDEEMLRAYREGHSVDAVGGAEAVISHVLSRALRVPCAHAPACAAMAPQAVAPRAAAEEIGHSFLPCVLVNLSSAPQLMSVSGPHSPRARGVVHAEDVDAVVVPASACGGASALALAARGATVIAVDDNTTTQRAYPTALGIDAIHVHSYLEAVGVIVALQRGICLDALRGVVRPLRRVG